MLHYSSCMLSSRGPGIYLSTCQIEIITFLPEERYLLRWS